MNKNKTLIMMIFSHIGVTRLCCPDTTITVEINFIFYNSENELRNIRKMSGPISGSYTKLETLNKIKIQ